MLFVYLFVVRQIACNILQNCLTGCEKNENEGFFESFNVNTMTSIVFNIDAYSK